LKTLNSNHVEFNNQKYFDVEIRGEGHHGNYWTTTRIRNGNASMFKEVSETIDGLLFLLKSHIK
jgi:hypothetical protein